MEAATVPARKPAVGIGQRVREFMSRFGLILLLLALPVYFAIDDLSTQGNLSRLGDNFVAGLSNGSIWALVAIGYTLVYGIVELINFAHGEVGDAIRDQLRGRIGHAADGEHEQGHGSQYPEARPVGRQRTPEDRARGMCRGGRAADRPQPYVGGRPFRASESILLAATIASPLSSNVCSVRCLFDLTLLSSM